MSKKKIVIASMVGVSFLMVLFFWRHYSTETNWNNQLNQDIQDIFGLLNNANTNENSDAEEKSKIDILRKKIKNYPADKISFLKRGGALYIAFNIAQDSDLIKRVNRDTLFYTPDFYSHQTKALMDSISKYQNADEALSVRKSMSKVWGDKDSVIPLKQNSIDFISSKNKETHLQMKKIYDSIFSNL